MKKKILQYLAQSVGVLSLFAAFASFGTASVYGAYQPKVPEMMQR